MTTETLRWRAFELCAMALVATNIYVRAGENVCGIGVVAKGRWFPGNICMAL